MACAWSFARKKGGLQRNLACIECAARDAARKAKTNPITNPINNAKVSEETKQKGSRTSWKRKATSTASATRPCGRAARRPLILPAS